MKPSLHLHVPGPATFWSTSSLTSCQTHRSSALLSATRTIQQMLLQCTISVLQSCGRTAAQPITAASAICSGTQKHRHRSWQVVAHRNPLQLRWLCQCSTSSPPPQITNSKILTRMGWPRIRGHKLICCLDTTTIDGMATKVGETGMIAQAGIVIVIVMLHHHRCCKHPSGRHENIVPGGT